MTKKDNPYLHNYNPDDFFESSRRRLRAPIQLLTDNVLPTGNDGHQDDPAFLPKGVRFRSIIEVLTTLPEEPYQVVAQGADSFVWHIPRTALWGEVGRQPNGIRIYVSPLCECVELPPETVIGLVAHELAHFILDHKGGDIHHQCANEEEVETIMQQWGFEEECAAMQKLHEFRF